MAVVSIELLIEFATTWKRKMFSKQAIICHVLAVKLLHSLVLLTNTNFSFFCNFETRQNLQDHLLFISLTSRQNLYDFRGVREAELAVVYVILQCVLLCDIYCSPEHFKRRVELP